MKDKLKNYLSSIIKEQMAERGIRISELAHDIGLPQTTVSRVASGATDNPTASTLIALSDYFGVSIDALLGRAKQKSQNCLIYTESKQNKIPLIPWEYIKKWVYNKEILLSSSNTIWLMTENSVSAEAFALEVETEFYGPTFPKGVNLVIDKKNDYLLNDIVLASVRRNKPTLWRVVEDGGVFYLNAIAINAPSERIGVDSIVYGKVIEYRMSFNMQKDLHASGAA